MLEGVFKAVKISKNSNGFSNLTVVLFLKENISPFDVGHVSMSHFSEWSLPYLKRWTLLTLCLLTPKSVLNACLTKCDVFQLKVTHWGFWCHRETRVTLATVVMFKSAVTSGLYSNCFFSCFLNNFFLTSFMKPDVSGTENSKKPSLGKLTAVSMLASISPCLWPALKTNPLTVLSISLSPREIHWNFIRASLHPSVHL